MSDRFDEQASRLNQFLARMGIRLTPERTREAMEHALAGVSDAQGPEQQEIRLNQIDRWAAVLGVTPEVLLDAIAVVGRQVSTVERYLRTGTPFQPRRARQDP